MKKILGILFMAVHAFTASAQNLTQTVRGVITDKVSQTPIPGALITLANSEPKKATVSDDDGNFKLLEVPVGKQTFMISMMGYKNFTLPNVVVNSGKEVVLNIALEESITETEEVVITAKVNKNKPLNDMSVVSSRTFSVEETQKYAAAVNDPARMATAFAGVVQTGDGNNNISIRGNSPNGLLWRMEGVEIPNPNHFSNVGTAGGGISILSAQLLSNSDFTTGAFAAEYGNALSGVFDLRLRKGNNEKREYTFQAGFLGIDFSTEGPFKKGYGGSYLFNYRYSTLGIISKLGVDIGDASTIFQDVSFNISLPTKKWGNFTSFGFGGLSSQKTTAVKDTSKWSDEFLSYNTDFNANTGAIGITHTKILNQKTFVKTSLVYSGTKNAYNEKKLDYAFTEHFRYAEEFINKKITFQSVLNHKFNAKLSTRAGFIVNNLNFNVSEKAYIDSTNSIIQPLFNIGNTYSIQAFNQWKYNLSQKITVNLGLHYLCFLLNNSMSLEPRASFKYEVSPKQSFSLGYGLHSQVQPLGVYFMQKQSLDNNIDVNHALGLSKAQHFVLAYDLYATEHLRFKIETYYQHLFNIPQGNDKTQNFSLLNQMGGIEYVSLNSNGTGRNYGLELTVEQFMHRNFYLLGSASLYDSKYKGTDGHMYNTRFNANYAFSFTSGKEFELSEKRKRKVIGINIKSTYSGGFRETPINTNASINAGYVVKENNRAYELQMPAYFRTDIRLSLKRNYKKATGTIAIDIQNISNRKNVGGQYYDLTSKQVKYYYQAGLIPILSYKIEF